MVLQPPAPRLLHAFADETGDRGLSPTASPFFSIAVLLAPNERLNDLTAAVTELRQMFKILPGVPLHWSKHIRQFGRRQKATERLLAVPDIKLVYVVFEKASLPPNSTLRTDTVRFYNHAASTALELIVQAADQWDGGERQVVVSFGHVRGFDHRLTQAFLETRPEVDGTVRHLPWHRLHGGFQGVRFDHMQQSYGLQAADCFAGILNCAMVADEYGGYEAMHLVRAASAVWRDPDRRPQAHGFKTVVSAGRMTAYPWWADCSL